MEFKGGYLDLSHRTELKNIYITEIYRKKKYKSSRIKNRKISRIVFYGLPLKGYVIFRFGTINKNKSIVGISSD